MILKSKELSQKQKNMLFSIRKVDPLIRGLIKYDKTNGFVEEENKSIKLNFLLI
jgi:hypothetical protein